MEVFLCFGRTLPLLNRQVDFFAPLMAQLTGPYISVSLVFVSGKGDGILTGFDVYGNTRVFEEQRSSVDVSVMQNFYDFLDLCVDVNEYERLLTTCRACVRARKRYNYRDVMLYNLPFREPMEKSLFETDTLFDSQAVILILRECLSAEHPVLPVVRALHSRTTMPPHLYEMLAPICVSTNATRLCALSREASVSVMQQEPRASH